MSITQLASKLGITAARLNEIVRGRRGITADTALRLARYLGTTPEFWTPTEISLRRDGVFQIHCWNGKMGQIRLTPF